MWLVSGSLSHKFSSTADLSSTALELSCACIELGPFDVNANCEKSRSRIFKIRNLKMIQKLRMNLLLVLYVFHSSSISVPLPCALDSSFACNQ